MSKKFLLLTSDFPPLSGGVANYLHGICMHSGVDTLVIAPQVTGSNVFDHVQPYQIIRVSTKWPSKLSRNLYLPLSWIRVASKIDDLSNSIVAGGIASIAIIVTLAYLSKIRRLKTTLLVHGGDIRSHSTRGPIYSYLLRNLLQCINHFVTNSEYTKSVLENSYGITPDRIQILNPGIDCSLFQMAQHIDIPGWTSGRKIILTVGRLVRHKGQDTLLKAIAILAKKGHDVGCIVIGSGPEKESLQALSRELAIDDRIFFAGFVSDDLLPNYYHACDIFALLSRKQLDGSVEGFGIVLLEAAACGKPVVATSEGGVTDAVVNGKSGILVDPLDITAIVSAFEALLLDKDLASSLGLFGRERVTRFFDWSIKRTEIQFAMGIGDDHECNISG